MAEVLPSTVQSWVTQVVASGLSHNYRLRLLLNIGLDWRAVTWQAAPATPIRGRQPRSVA